MLVTHLHHGLHGSVPRSVRVLHKKGKKEQRLRKEKKVKERAKTKKITKGQRNNKGQEKSISP